MTHLNNTGSSRLPFARARQARVLGLVCGSMAFVALTFAGLVAPASAQGVPADLLRLDPPQPRPMTAGDSAAVRGAFARMGDEDLADARSFCMQRFRSYDPGSGTYLGHDGRRHPCP